MQSDSFGMWLQMRRLKPNISTASLQNHETEIIGILGGIEKIIDSMLKSFGSLTFDSSIKLINLFNKISEEEEQTKSESTDERNVEEQQYEDDNDDNDDDEDEDEEQIHILDCPQSLISHICSFLHLTELISFDKTCSDISSICHIPSSLYELDEYQYEKLSRSIDKKISYYLQSYSYYDQNILSDILNKLSEQIDVYRFTKLRKICINTQFTAKIKSINDYPINPMTQYFIFKNIINKLSHHPLEKLTVSHFEVKESAIFDNMDKWSTDRLKIIDLKDYFPTFQHIKKLKIPCSLQDEDEWNNPNQHFSFLFSHIYGVQSLDIPGREIPDELFEYILNNKNDFNVTDITFSLFSSPSMKQLKKYNKSFNFNSLNGGLNKYLFGLCQQTLSSLHLGFKALQSVIKDTDFSNITFMALRELCLKDFSKNCFISDQDIKPNCFKVPNLEILTLNATVFQHQFEWGPDKDKKAMVGSILNILQMFEIKCLSVLKFKGSFSNHVTEEHGNQTMLLWLQDINKCLTQEDINIFRMNIDLKFIEKNLWDYKQDHLEELINILNSFDETNHCESILIELECVCTAKWYLLDIRDSAQELGWNVNIDWNNWRYIQHAKRTGEVYTFRKGPICHQFVKYPCFYCS